MPPGYALAAAVFPYDENSVSADSKSDERADSADPATEEALRYRTALYDGYSHLEDYPLCTNTAIAICTKLRAAQTEGSEIKEE